MKINLRTSYGQVGFYGQVGKKYKTPPFVYKSMIKCPQYNHNYLRLFFSKLHY